MPDKKITDKEIFKVGDCVASIVCPNMIGTITHISGECEETTIIVNVGGNEVLGDADYWRKVKVKKNAQ